MFEKNCDCHIGAEWHVVCVPRRDMYKLLFPFGSALCRRVAVMLCLLAAGTGCSLHRVEFVPQPITSVAAFSDTKLPGVQSASKSEWWLTIGSVKLDEYIQLALAQNQTVEAARARLVQAEALLRRAGAANKPFIDLKAHSERDLEARARREDYWEAGATLAWEIDVFGRLASTRVARVADVDSRSNQLIAVKLALSAAVAEAFLGVIEQKELLLLLKRQRDASVEFLKIIQERFDQGLISLVDLLQQKSQLSDIESLIPDADSNLRVQQNILLTLIGRAPADFETLVVDDALPFAAPLPMIGSPSDLLMERPDLRSARSDLVAADADIGRAMAERLPKFSFSSDGLYVEGRGRSGFLWTATPSLLAPLLDWGSRRAEVSRVKAVYRERLAVFSQLYVDAILEVENAVVREIKQKELIERLDERRTLLEAALQQTKERYTAGLTDYLPVLTSLQQLNAVEQRLIRERRRLLSMRVTLHRALGGPFVDAEK
jgi:NodT family efflux transporter outer membrane factor (OMF) lipoprotein